MVILLGAQRSGSGVKTTSLGMRRSSKKTGTISPSTCLHVCNHKQEIARESSPNASRRTHDANQTLQTLRRNRGFRSNTICFRSFRGTTSRRRVVPGGRCARGSESRAQKKTSPARAVQVWSGYGLDRCSEGKGVVPFGKLSGGCTATGGSPATICVTMWCSPGNERGPAVQTLD